MRISPRASERQRERELLEPKFIFTPQYGKFVQALPGDFCITLAWCHLKGVFRFAWFILFEYNSFLLIALLESDENSKCTQVWTQTVCSGPSEVVSGFLHVNSTMTRLRSKRGSTRNRPNYRKWSKWTENIWPGFSVLRWFLRFQCALGKG